MKLNAVFLIAVLLAGQNLFAQDSEESDAETERDGGFWSQFIDPDDGKLDMSQWLLANAYGFLPVPIIISEPAVDDGLGVAAIFFHEPDADVPPPEEGDFILPDVSAAAAAVTGNSSWFVGGGHFNTWKQDARRYTGMAGFADINLDFFGLPELPPIPGGKLGFNAKGFFTDHELLFRMGRTDWFLGGDFRYLTSDVTLDLNTGIPELDSLSSEDTISGIGLVAQYEKVNSTFTPDDGLSAEFLYRVNDDALGSDFDYDEFNWKIRQYFRFGEKYSLAWRLDGSTTSGDVPFYMEPFVDLQGIPAMRYQGGSVATAEVRGGYNFTPRWSVVGFVGAGRAADSLSDLGSATTRSAYGAGFRYLMAKLLNMKVGIDVARGPEDTVIYLVTGTAW